MTNLQQRLNARAIRLQRQGRVGGSMKLRILAAEAKTMRYGPETTHGAGDVR